MLPLAAEPIIVTAMDVDLDKLQADIDAARASYFAERKLLVKTAGWIYADGATAADAIEGLAEELGPSKAVEQLLVLPHVYGELGPTASDQVIADQSDGLEPMLERLLDAHDRLDVLTRERADILAAQQPGRLRVINIGGREFEVDTNNNELRSVENHQERYSLADEGGLGRGQGGSELTLTEQFAKATGADKTTARPPTDRTRDH